MDSFPSRGRIYRSCGCRDEKRKQLGTRCPKLAEDQAHGSWGYSVDLPSPDKKRDTRRRIGFADYDEAEQALERVLQAERTGVFEEPKMSVSDYLTQWLAMREKVLRPTTFANYSENVHNDLLPVFGTMKLRDLRARHIDAWIHAQLEAGRGPMIAYRVGATLRTALNAAVKSRQMVYNPALYAVIPRPTSAERLCWSPAQAAAFLRHNAASHADPLADLYEVMIGTGLRRGEVLGLHWADVHLMDRTLFVRWTLTAVTTTTSTWDRPRPRPAATGSASTPASPPPSTDRPTSTAPSSPREPPWKGWCSPATTAPRCARSGSWTSCADVPPRSACPRSAW